MDNKPLSAREAAFVQHFLIGGNATEAYIKAGYSSTGAKQNASRLRSKENVASEIDRLQSKQRIRHEATADQTISALAQIAFSGLSKFVTINEDGLPEFDFSECDAPDLDLLSEITTESWTEGSKDAKITVRKVKIKAYSRLDAIKTLMQHFGLLTGKSPDHSVDRFQQLMDEIQKRRSMLPTLPTGPLGHNRMKTVN